MAAAGDHQQIRRHFFRLELGQDFLAVAEGDKRVFVAVDQKRRGIVGGHLQDGRIVGGFGGRETQRGIALVRLRIFTDPTAQIGGREVGYDGGEAIGRRSGGGAPTP